MRPIDLHEGVIIIVIIILEELVFQMITQKARVNIFLCSYFMPYSAIALARYTQIVSTLCVHNALRVFFLCLPRLSGRLSIGLRL